MDILVACEESQRVCVSFREKVADGRQKAAIEFFMEFTGIEKGAIENPVGIMSSVYRKPDQIIQPYLFGEDASKRTCLWLFGLPELKPTEFVHPKSVNGKWIWGNQTKSGQNKLGPSENRAKLRGITYWGVARAMASQWVPDQSISRQFSALSVG